MCCGPWGCKESDRTEQLNNRVPRHLQDTVVGADLEQRKAGGRWRHQNRTQYPSIGAEMGKDWVHPRSRNNALDRRPQAASWRTEQRVSQLPPSAGASLSGKRSLSCPRTVPSGLAPANLCTISLLSQKRRPK